MVDRAADVSAVRGSDDDRSRERVVRPPAHGRQLVPDLHVRRPDVVEELDLDDGLEAPERHADRAADDVGFSERRVVYAQVAEFLLQTPRNLEDPALALDLVEVLPARGVGDVFAKDDDA